jgi:hypothetical protein
MVPKKAIEISRKHSPEFAKEFIRVTRLSQKLRGIKLGRFTTKYFVR